MQKTGTGNSELQGRVLALSWAVRQLLGNDLDMVQQLRKQAAEIAHSDTMPEPVRDAMHREIVTLLGTETALEPMRLED